MVVKKKVELRETGEKLLRGYCALHDRPLAPLPLVAPMVVNLIGTVRPQIVLRPS